MPRSAGVVRHAREATALYLCWRTPCTSRGARTYDRARNQRQEASEMRNLGRGVIVGVVLATACGGGAKNADTTSTAAPPAGAPAAGSSAAAPAAGAAAAGTATAQPATGKTWEVKMLGDASGYKYDPANLTIKEGDAVKFTVTSG